MMIFYVFCKITIVAYYIVKLSCMHFYILIIFVLADPAARDAFCLVQYLLLKKREHYYHTQCRVYSHEQQSKQDDLIIYWSDMKHYQLQLNLPNTLFFPTKSVY